MKCFLHIGTEKTGTTLLQNWLYDNKEQLSKKSIYLSDRLGGVNNRFVPVFFQNHLDDWAATNGIKNNEDKDKFFNGFLDELAAEVNKSSLNHDIFIITSEHFHSRVRTVQELSRLNEFLSGLFDTIEVICYFREQYDLGISLYSTALKLGSTMDVDDFMEEVNPANYYYNHFQIAENWAMVFGKENCKFKIYDRKLFLHGDIRKDFLQIVSCHVDFNELNMSRISSNESLYLFQSIAYKTINRKISYWRLDGGGVNNINLMVKKMIDEVQSLNFGKINAQNRNDIRSRFLESNNAFELKYIGHPAFVGLEGLEDFNEECEGAALKVIEELVDLYLEGNHPLLQGSEK